VNKVKLHVRQSYTFALLVCVVCLSVGTYLIPIDWLDRFIQVGNVDLYRLTFLISITNLYIVIRRFLTHRNNLLIVLYGFIAGVSSSMVAILVMSFAYSYGKENIRDATYFASYAEIFGIYLVWSLVLGGWSFGVMLSILMRLVYVGREEQQ